ncbi:uncharacterized protein TM35_000084340 [Trypanosoma theileri]|uniref:Mucin-associated surface protein (MASP) n=1 Tax=Trypanosoma theileri TaxID=67003 RepID=A0A1X0P122_9TRYP|nr:uncharacterized protein TM35_000084340 [Trypanosoma theileri]ORC90636.1 hypothetical protein TM35_000084340 [Trypanosoma theileri]
MMMMMGRVMCVLAVVLYCACGYTMTAAAEEPTQNNDGHGESGWNRKDAVNGTGWYSPFDSDAVEEVDVCLGSSHSNKKKCEHWRKDRSMAETTVGTDKERVSEDVISLPEQPQQQRLTEQSDLSRPPAAVAASAGTHGVGDASHPRDQVKENPVVQEIENTLTGQAEPSTTGLETPGAQPGGTDNVEVPADASHKIDQGQSQNGTQPGSPVEGPSHSGSEPSTTNRRNSENAETTQTNVQETPEGHDSSAPTSQNTVDASDSSLSADNTGTRQDKSVAAVPKPAEGNSNSEEPTTTTTTTTLPPEPTNNKKGDADSSSSISSSVWVRVPLLIVFTLACILVC